MVVRCWRYWNWTIARIDSCCDTRGEHGRERFGKSTTDRVATVEPSASVSLALGMDGSGYDISWCKISFRMVARHEWSTLKIDQHGTFAAQGFGNKRRWIAAACQGRGVKLYELGVSNHGAYAERLRHR